jgi:hypothetical protein
MLQILYTKTKQENGIKYALISTNLYSKQYLTIILHSNKKHFNMHTADSSTILLTKTRKLNHP